MIEALLVYLIVVATCYACFFVTGLVFTFNDMEEAIMFAACYTFVACVFLPVLGGIIVAGAWLVQVVVA